MQFTLVKCPVCGGTNISKNGTKNGKQRYICNNKKCPGKSFMLEYKYNGCKPGIDEQIVKMAANASGINDTARVLGVSPDKVTRVLKKRKTKSAT